MWSVDVFGVADARNLGGNLLKDVADARNNQFHYNLQRKSLTRMRNSTLLCWRDLIMDRLAARNLNKNL